MVKNERQLKSHVTVNLYNLEARVVIYYRLVVMQTNHAAERPLLLPMIVVKSAHRLAVHALANKPFLSSHFM